MKLWIKEMWREEKKSSSSDISMAREIESERDKPWIKVLFSHFIYLHHCNGRFACVFDGDYLGWWSIAVIYRKHMPLLCRPLQIGAIPAKMPSQHYITYGSSGCGCCSHAYNEKIEIKIKGQNRKGERERKKESRKILHEFVLYRS